MTRYSVLMSLYARENPAYLRTAIESMFNQTVPPDEVVLVEDGQLTEELYAVLDEYRERLHIVVSENNVGLGPALAMGLLACENELVARMDTDDVAVPDRCEKQLRYFDAHPVTTILGGQIEEFIDNPDEIIGRRVVPESDADLKEYMKKRCPFNHMTVMFRKSDVIQAGNYREWFWNEDYYLWIRLALEGFEFANLPDTLVFTRVGADMYRRRGGDRYFKSEMGIQRLMLEKKLIGFGTYLDNCAKRLVVEKLLPNRVRGWVFRKFARES